MTTKRATIILCHGAWADGSSWNSVIQPLRDLSFEVMTAPIPLTSLSDDVAMVKRCINRAQGPVVLVGHAYGGAVISSVDDDRVKSVVLVAALAPAVEETVASVFFKEEPDPRAPKLAPDADGFIWMPEDGFQKAFAQNASDSVKRNLWAVQRPINAACIQETVTFTNWNSKPSWYLLAEQDRMIKPLVQRFMAERMKAKIRPVACDHTPSITAPRSVVEIIAEAVTDHEIRRS